MSSMTYKWVEMDWDVKRYADTKEEAFNLLVSCTLTYRGNAIAKRTVREMYRESPPKFVSKEEYESYGMWVSEGEITNTLLSIKKKFSMSLDNIISDEIHSVEEIIEHIDHAFHEYEKKYIIGISQVLEVIAMGIRMKLNAFTKNKNVG